MRNLSQITSLYKHQIKLRGVKYIVSELKKPPCGVTLSGYTGHLVPKPLCTLFLRRCPVDYEIMGEFDYASSKSAAFVRFQVKLKDNMQLFR